MKLIRIFAGILVSLLLMSVTTLVQNTAIDDRPITESSYHPDKHILREYVKAKSKYQGG